MQRIDFCELKKRICMLTRNRFYQSPFIKFQDLCDGSKFKIVTESGDVLVRNKWSKLTSLLGECKASPKLLFLRDLLGAPPPGLPQNSLNTSWCWKKQTFDKYWKIQVSDQSVVINSRAVIALNYKSLPFPLPSPPLLNRIWQIVHGAAMNTNYSIMSTFCGRVYDCPY